MRIGAAIMVRNMAPLIGATVQSLDWVDSIFLYDDGSDDRSAEVASAAAAVPLYIETSADSRPAFERGEALIRNYVIDQAFSRCDCDMLLVIDADELMSSQLRIVIEDVWKGAAHDHISLSIWHLYDELRYLHFYETTFNGVRLIDPHTRVIRRGKYFETMFRDGSHPALKATPQTLCLNGPYHFHLKYFYRSPYPNYALDFLPRRLDPDTVKPYLRPLPFSIPDGVLSSLRSIHWDKLGLTDTPYYDVYLPHKDQSSDMISIDRPRQNGADFEVSDKAKTD